jgi:hypothetical protein
MKDFGRVEPLDVLTGFNDAFASVRASESLKASSLHFVDAISLLFFNPSSVSLAGIRNWKRLRPQAVTEHRGGRKQRPSLAARPFRDSSTTQENVFSVGKRTGGHSYSENRTR